MKRHSCKRCGGMLDEYFRCIYCEAKHIILWDANDVPSIELADVKSCSIIPIRSSRILYTRTMYEYPDFVEYAKRDLVKSMADVLMPYTEFDFSNNEHIGETTARATLKVVKEK